MGNLSKGILLFIVGFIPALTLVAQPDWAQKNSSIELIGKIKPKNSKQISGSKFGVGFECLDRRMYTPEPYFDIAASLGVKHARCQTGWHRTEIEKGKYDFKWLDEVVDNLLARGIQPWFNVGYGNGLYKPLENKYAIGHVPLFYGEECLQAWKNYVRALAKHFKGRVKDFEIWNEPNIRTFWRKEKINAKKYVDLIELTAKEIKAEIPDAKIGAAIAGGYGKYFKDMFKNRAGNTLDFFSIHAYRLLPERSYTNMVACMEKFVKANGGKTKIRQGEAGFPYNIPKECWYAKSTWHKSNETIQAKLMLRQFVQDASSNVDLTSFFMITDFNSNYALGKNAQIDTFAWGMTENSKSSPRQRVVCQAMRNFLSIFDENVKLKDCGITVDYGFPKKARVSYLPELAANAACKTFLKNGKPMHIFYSPEDLQLQSGVIDGVKICISNSEPIENPVLVDFMSGNVYRVKNMDSLPLVDYPMLLVSESTIADVLDKSKN